MLVPSRYLVLLCTSVWQLSFAYGQHCEIDGDQVTMLQVRPDVKEGANSILSSPEEVYRRRLFKTYIIDEGRKDALSLTGIASSRASSDPLDKYIEVVDSPSDTYGSIRLLVLLFNAVAVCVFWRYTRRQKGNHIKTDRATLAFVICATLIATGCTCTLLYHAAFAWLRDAVEMYDISYLGVRVKIGQLSFNLFTGVLDLKGVLVSNPAGYAHDDIFRVEGLAVGFDIPSTVSSFFQTISVRAITAVGVQAMYEQSSTTSNVAELANRVHLLMQAQSAGEMDTKGTNAAVQYPSSIGIKVHSINISRIEVDGVLPSTDSKSISLFAPDLVLGDFDKDRNKPRSSSYIIQRTLADFLDLVLKVIEG